MEKRVLMAVLLLAAAVPAVAASPEAVAILVKASPRIKAICPGLAKYSADLRRQPTEDNFDYAPANAQRVSMLYRVAEDPAQIPGEFNAAGHSCAFDVSRDGKRLLIGKRACAMVCFDRTLTSAEDQASPITLDL